MYKYESFCKHIIDISSPDLKNNFKVPDESIVIKFEIEEEAAL